MPLPISRTQLDKLGQRLAAGTASPDDLLLLEEVLAAYDEVISRALEIIEPLGFRPTSRLKTSGTLIEKLQRERGMMLKGVQDIAGLRIVLSRDQDQDEVVANLVGELTAATGAHVRIHDRRENPSSGYRAVHLVAKIENLPVEIQIRTFLQDRWAQAFEALADRWGRQIRYGFPPDPPPIEDERRARFRHELVAAMRNQVADAFSGVDRVRAELRKVRFELASADPRTEAYSRAAGFVREREVIEPERDQMLLAMLAEVASLADVLDGGHS